MRRRFRFLAFALVAIGPFRLPAVQASNHALLIGCTDYPRLLEEHGPKVYEQSIRLLGPRNDVNLFRQLLVEQFGFSPDSITTLVGWDESDEASRPTRANIAKAFRELGEKARNGDQVVILIAGHGSHQPAPEEDRDEIDGRDEIFLPADAGGWLTDAGRVDNAILDNEIGEWLTAIRRKGALVWINFDVCHAGTMTRGGLSEVARDRFLDPDLLGVPEDSTPAALRTRGGTVARTTQEGDLLDLRENDGGLVAIYATQPYERAPEMPLPLSTSKDPENYHGLLTFTVSEVLRQSRSPLTYRELVQRVLSSYQSIPWTVPTPFAEGDSDREVLGLVEWPERAILQIRSVATGLEASGGALAGLTEGSILAVYPPAGAEQATEILGCVQVKDVTATRAVVEPVAYGDYERLDPAKISDRSRGEILVQDLGDWRLEVAVQSARSKSSGDVTTHPPENLPERLSALVTELGDSAGSLIHLTGDLAAAHWLIRAERENVWLLPAEEPVGADAETPTLARGPYPLDAPSKSAPDLATDLRRIYRSQNLRRIASSSAAGLPEASTAGLAVELRICDAGFEACVPATPGGKLSVGQAAELRVDNHGREAMDVTVLFLDSSYGILPVFPRDGRYNRIQPNESLPAQRFHISAETFGREHIVVFGALARRGSEPKDFTWLAQPTFARTRGGSYSALDDLLATAAFGEGKTRGYESAGEAKSSVVVELITWVTVP